MTATAVDQAPLTALDRCDRCGAAAKVRATLIGGELLFCGHHARKGGEHLKKSSINFYDPENALEYGSQ